VLVWYYHDDDLPGPDAAIDLKLAGIGHDRLKLTHYRIDADHSNSYEAWKRMGSPLQPTPEQYAQLEKAGQLSEFGRPEIINVKDGAADVGFRLPRQGVSLLLFNWE